MKFIGLLFLAIGIVLFGCTGYGPNPTSMPATKCGGFSYFECSNAIVTTESVNVVLKNAMGRKLTVVNAFVNGKQCYEGNQMELSETGVLPISCNNQNGAVVYGEQGKTFEAQVSVEFEDPRNGQRTNDKGGYIRGIIR